MTRPTDLNQTPPPISLRALAGRMKVQAVAHLPGTLRPHKVHPLRVELRVPPGTDPKPAIDPSKLQTGPKPVRVRMVVPGAFVVPAEQILDPGDGRSTKAVFHVTPLSDGHLSGAFLDVSAQGRS